MTNAIILMIAGMLGGFVGGFISIAIICMITISHKYDEDM